MKLDWLPKRISFGDVTGGGEGGSMETKDSRPAMSETRCWDDRRRGRGAEGERADGGCMLLELESIRMRGDELPLIDDAGVRESAESKGEREMGESDCETGSAVNRRGWAGVEWRSGWVDIEEVVTRVAGTLLGAFARVLPRDRGWCADSGRRKLFEESKL